MLKFVSQDWKGEVSWAWSLSCSWLTGMDVLQLLPSLHLMEAGGEEKWKSLLSLVSNVEMMARDGDFAGEALGLQAQGAWTKGIAYLAAGAPSHCFSQKCHSSAQM